MRNPEKIESAQSSSYVVFVLFFFNNVSISLIKLVLHLVASPGLRNATNFCVWDICLALMAECHPENCYSTLCCFFTRLVTPTTTGINVFEAPKLSLDNFWDLDIYCFSSHSVLLSPMLLGTVTSIIWNPPKSSTTMLPGKFTLLSVTTLHKLP